MKLIQFSYFFSSTLEGPRENFTSFLFSFLRWHVGTRLACFYRFLITHWLRKCESWCFIDFSELGWSKASTGIFETICIPNVSIKMRCFTMFITVVCVIFLRKAEVWRHAEVCVVICMFNMFGWQNMAGVCIDTRDTHWARRCSTNNWATGCKQTKTSLSLAASRISNRNGGRLSCHEHLMLQFY